MSGRPGPKPKSDSERFWSKVGKGDDAGACWPWLAATCSGGRGSFKSNGKTRMAHRVSAELAGIKVGPGQVVCHKCDNPGCMNPAHFFVGTQKDNVRDMWAKGRQFPPPGCPTGGIRYGWDHVESVRELRRAGLLHREIAVAVGMSEPNISRILAGKIRVSA